MVDPQHAELSDEGAQQESEVPQHASLVSILISFAVDILISFKSMNFDMIIIHSHRSLSMYAYGVATTLTLTKAPKAISKLAEQYKALGDQTRLRLVFAVAAGENAEACVCDLTPDTGLAQSTVSHHLKLLVDAGFLERSQRGKWAYYSLTQAAKEFLK